MGIPDLLLNEDAILRIVPPESETRSLGKPEPKRMARESKGCDYWHDPANGYPRALVNEELA